MGQRRSTIDLRKTILQGGVLLVNTAQGGVLLVNTAQGIVGRDVAALVGASLLNLVDSVIREQQGMPLEKRRGALVVVDEMQSMPGVDFESMLSELGKFGASFVLATQSLAKLDDLAPTMRESILANVGCLVIFQVAASDARTLVWEMGRDRVSEEDITSLPVHHCYVRATVGKERVPAFSMKVRKPAPGCVEVASLVRDATSAYTTPAQQADYADAELHQKVGDYHQAVENLMADDAMGTVDELPAGDERRMQTSKKKVTADNGGEADEQDGHEDPTVDTDQKGETKG